MGDEIEKAHGDVLNILLQIMEDGILTDGKGRTVNFKNAILIMTSNVGSQRVLELSRSESAKSDSMDKLYKKYSKVVHEQLEAQIRPELLNRIDEIVVFSPLDANKLESITKLLLQKTISRAEKEQEIKISVGDGLLRKVSTLGAQQVSQFGARPMRRVAQRYLEDSLSDAIISGFIAKGDTVLVDFVENDNTIGEADDDNSSCVIITRRSDMKSMNVR